MKQIIQNLKSGETLLEEVPVPAIKSGHVLIKTHRSLVSLGTERMLVEFSQANLLSKARQQPDKVKQVLDKIKSDGLIPTLETVFRKLDEPLPLGYCNAGEVVGVGKNVNNFRVGDRVISNGRHAEFVCVPKNLVAHIPDNLSYEEASFTVISSIGLQGIRLANPTLGETVVVVGLGLIGLLSVQLLRANGCKVIGLDVDDKKVELAKSFGIHAINVLKEDPVGVVLQRTENIGADAVIITASNKSNDIIHQAATMSRKRGRIILVGVIGLNLLRSDFYEKELSFQVSCSYGPGRYEDSYEAKGIDYPLPFVRWTENRNFQAILHALSAGDLRVKPLISEILKLQDFNKIYGNIGKSKSIATILEYPEKSEIKHLVQLDTKNYAKTNGTLGIIGAGNFTKMNMLPKLKSLNADIKYIASAGGLSSTILAKKYGISNSTSDYHSILSDQDVAGVIVTTRHNMHARMVKEAIQASKNVFVEKPLAIQLEEFREIQQLMLTTDKNVMVGFNRRFSPFAQKAKSLLGNETDSLNVIATMNAGNIPESSWVHDLESGGGRIIGEACHLIDLISFWVGDKISSVTMSALGKQPKENTDNAVLILKYANGAQGVVNYFANGNKSYPKERFEIYSMGRNLVLDNFRKMEGYGFSGFSKMSSKQDKGHKEQFARYIKFLKEGGSPLITFAEIENTTLATFAAIQSLKESRTIYLDEYNN